jgi:homocitrate synthase NifV
MDDANGRVTAVASPKVSDATLRDTAHMAGVCFDVDDARTLAGLLCDVGIDIVEAGIVSSSDRSEVPLVQAVAEVAGRERTKTVILARSRKQVEEDLDAALETGAGNVMLSIPTSPTHAMLKLGTDSQKRITTLAARGIEAARAAGFSVTFSAEDGARTDPAFLEEYVAAGAEAGADRFRLAETVSSLAPNDVAPLIGRLVAAAGRTEVEMHSHNMLGLSVANALAAADAGAAWISCTIDGLGERGGNTPLAETLCVLHVLRGVDRFNLQPLTELSREAASRAGLRSSATTGPTAELSYQYEIPGQVRNPEAFVLLEPEVVGNASGVRIGSRLKPALLEAFLSPETLDGVDVEAVVERIRESAPSEKHVWDLETLDELVRLHGHELRAERATATDVSPVT